MTKYQIYDREWFENSKPCNRVQNNVVVNCKQSGWKTKRSLHRAKEEHGEMHRTKTEGEGLFASALTA